MRQLIDQQSRTAQERAELQAALDKEAEDRKIIELQKAKLAAKLKVKKHHTFYLFVLVNSEVIIFKQFSFASAALDFSLRSALS